MMRCAVIGVGFALVLGCAKAEPKNEFMPMSEVAPELVKVAQKTLPDVKFEAARKRTINGEEVYEIRGKQPNGKIREVEVSVSGNVIEIE